MTVNNRLFIVGGSGFIGSRLVEEATRRGYPASYTYASKPLVTDARGYRVDLTGASAGDLEKFVRAEEPASVIYCAVPAPIVQAGEEDHRAISLEGVKRVVAALKPGGRFIYVSTNMVFGGGKGPYTEMAAPDPEQRQDPYRFYGLYKTAGERLALESWPDTIVARTCVVDGRLANGQLSPRLAGLFQQLKAGQSLHRFTDRYFSPTLVGNFCKAIFEALEPEFRYRGILHLAGAERINDFDYARKLARYLGYDESLVKPDNLANSPAMRHSPPDTSLDVAFTQSLLKTPLLTVDEQFIQLFPQK
ncbi:MAG TPA: sugar nucleotide-binding protein [Chloroflexia bacterium]|nr:sugar nucleotide-binding protein [Chloroflexia bacterium]